MNTMMNISVATLNSEGREITKATTSCRTPLAKSRNFNNRAILKTRKIRRALGLIFPFPFTISRTIPAEQNRNNVVRKYCTSCYYFDKISRIATKSEFYGWLECFKEQNKINHFEFKCRWRSWK